MPSQLTLDRTDGGVDAMVAPWNIGEEYELRLRVREISASETKVVFDVIEATDETTEATPEDEAPAEPEYTPPAKPAKTGKPALTIK